MRRKAIQFMLISTLAFSALNTCIKYLSEFNVYQIVFFRSLGSLFFTIPFLVKNQISFLGHKKGLLVFRSVVGLISMALFIASVKLLPMGTAVSIRYIAPIFATCFALIWLNEKVKPIQWLFFLVAFIGVLILKGIDGAVNTLGLLYALGSSIFAGLVYISIRKIGDADHPVVVVNYFMVISTLIGGLFTFYYWVTPQGWEWLIFASLGVFGYAAQLYMTKAFQAAETNEVAPLKYAEVIFTMLIGLVWFGETYPLSSLLGIFLIVSGLTLNTLSKKY